VLKAAGFEALELEVESFRLFNGASPGGKPLLVVAAQSLIAGSGSSEESLLEIGGPGERFMELWKEEDRIFISLPTARVHADPDQLERLTAIAELFGPSFKQIRSFSRPTVPSLVVVSPFSLLLYARQVLKVLALDEVPLRLRQCVLTHPLDAGSVARWLVDEISGQWLSLALHIDIYGQPIAAVRSATSRVTYWAKQMAQAVTFGLLGVASSTPPG